MYKINIEDIIIKHYPEPNCSGFVSNVHEGASVYHKPSGIEIKCESKHSHHQNKTLCLKILQDKLTEVNSGDMIVTKDGLAEVDFVHYRSSTMFCYFSDETGGWYEREFIAHTEEGFKYLQEENLNKELYSLETKHESERKVIVGKVDDLNKGY